MIIGVDAGALSIRDERLKVGVWRVTHNLLTELATIDTKNEYRLYTFTELDERFGNNFKNVLVRPMFGWSTIGIPIELQRHPVDVFLGLSQMIPVTNIKKIGFIHDLGFLHFPDAYPDSYNRLKYQTEKLVARSNAIITVSQSSALDIDAHYPGHPPVTVVYEGVDDRFSAVGRKHKEQHPYIVFVGALKRIKNIPFALKVFKEFLDTEKVLYDFVLVGGNYWEDPEIAGEIEHLGLTGRVILKGYVADNDLASYYRGAQAILITSLWEGFCLPAAEAIACGCPVVYGRTGSLPEIVGDLGSSYEPGNIDSALLALRERFVPKIKKYRWDRFGREVYRIITSQ